MQEDEIAESKKELIAKEKAALEAKEKLTKAIVASKKKWMNMYISLFKQP